MSVAAVMSVATAHELNCRHFQPMRVGVNKPSWTVTEFQRSNYSDHLNTGLSSVRYSNGTTKEWQLRNIKMVITQPSHLNTGLVQYSDGYCTWFFTGYQSIIRPVLKRHLSLPFNRTPGRSKGYQLMFISNRPSGFNSSTMFKRSWRLRTQVWIPAQDYNIARSEVEILCLYSNSRAPGDMCCLRYQTERDAIVPKNWY